MIKLFLFLLIPFVGLAQDTPCDSLKAGIERAEKPIALFSGYLQYLNFVKNTVEGREFEADLVEQFEIVNGLFTENAYVHLQFDKVITISNAEKNGKSEFFSDYYDLLDESSSPQILRFSIDSLKYHANHIYYDTGYYVVFSINTELQYSLMKNHTAIVERTYFVRLRLINREWKINCIHPYNRILAIKYYEDLIMIDCK